MAVARYYKTLFVPPLEGQYKIWSNDLVKIAAKVDEIVQLGNLIWLGTELPENIKPITKTARRNLAMLNFILLWRVTYSKWTQLIGPNEILALNFPDEWTNDKSNKLLRSRWFDKDTVGGFRTASVNKSRLVTHGGLSYGLWVRLGRPKTADEAADALNEEFNGTLYQGRSFKLNQKPNFSVDPIFADPIKEVYPSWITADEEMPFSQVHSSSGLNTLNVRGQLNEESSYLKYFDHIDYTKFGSIVTLGDNVFVSVSPDIPKINIINRMPKAWHPYIEKIPVIDLRTELFEK